MGAYDINAHMRRDLFVKCGIDGIEILLIHLFYGAAESLSEALIMDDLPLAQELYGIVYVRIIAEPQDIVIGRARFLLRRHILGKVGYNVALDGH